MEGSAVGGGRIDGQAAHLIALDECLPVFLVKDGRVGAYLETIMLIVTGDFWLRRAGPGVQAPLFVIVWCLILGRSVWKPPGTLKFTYGHTGHNTRRTKRTQCGARWRRECGYELRHFCPLATMCA